MSGSGTIATRGGLLALVAVAATLVFGATAQAATINVNTGLARIAGFNLALFQP